LLQYTHKFVIILSRNRRKLLTKNYSITRVVFVRSIRTANYLQSWITKIRTDMTDMKI